MARTATPKTTAPASWQDVLAKSEAERAKGEKFKANAGALLWTGAKAAISEWNEDSSEDVGAEVLYNDVMEALGGNHRKGDASKIKTVALAVKQNGLDMADFPNLSRAYAEAKRLTKTVQEQKVEDDALGEAIEKIAESAPKSSSTVEGAALLLLSRGEDGAVVAILDALGKDNEAAHRSFLRAVSTEISARVQAKAQTAKAEADAKRKEEAEKKKAEREAKIAAQKKEREEAAAKRKAEREEAAKAKTPAKKTAAKKTTAAPAKAKPKGAPVKRATPKVEAPVTESLDDMFDEVDETEVESSTVNDGVETGPQAPRKGVPVKRPVKR